ncbi:hypothetical protein ACLMJK_002449 [Lecanora helva]
MAALPDNPAICRETGRPRDRGEIKISRRNGGLYYKNPVTQRWEPAVHLDDIRGEVLLAWGHLGQYTYARRQGQENDNVTAFLPEDRSYGGNWNERPQLLFQIMEPADQHSSKSIAFVRYGSRIVLDPYDHGIRDFPGELPVALSTEIEGWEIEYYLRKNNEIKPYDLMARMRSSYTDSKGKKQDAPPRIFTLSERATKFREKAALPAINKRLGSELLKDYTMQRLPVGARDIRSLGRDRTAEEVKEMKSLNKGQHPHKRKKAKRENEANQNDDGSAFYDDEADEQQQTIQPYYYPGSGSSMTFPGVGFPYAVDQGGFGFTQPAPGQMQMHGHAGFSQQQMMPLDQSGFYQPAPSRQQGTRTGIRPSAIPRPAGSSVRYTRQEPSNLIPFPPNPASIVQTPGPGPDLPHSSVRQEQGAPSATRTLRTTSVGSEVESSTAGQSLGRQNFNRQPRVENPRQQQRPPNTPSGSANVQNPSDERVGHFERRKRSFDEASPNLESSSGRASKRQESSRPAEVPPPTNRRLREVQRPHYSRPTASRLPSVNAESAAATSSQRQDLRGQTHRPTTGRSGYGTSATRSNSSNTRFSPRASVQRPNSHPLRQVSFPNDHSRQSRGGTRVIEGRISRPAPHPNHWRKQWKALLSFVRWDWKALGASRIPEDFLRHFISPPDAMFPIRQTPPPQNTIQASMTSEGHTREPPVESAPANASNGGPSNEHRNEVAQEDGSQQRQSDQERQQPAQPRPQEDALPSNSQGNDATDSNNELPPSVPSAHGRNEGLTWMNSSNDINATDLDSLYPDVDWAAVFEQIEQQGISGLEEPQATPTEPAPGVSDTATANNAYMNNDGDYQDTPATNAAPLTSDPTLQGSTSGFVDPRSTTVNPMPETSYLSADFNLDAMNEEFSLQGPGSPVDSREQVNVNNGAGSAAENFNFSINQGPLNPEAFEEEWSTLMANQGN